MPNNILFLTLKTFSLTGGIEKVCKCFCKILENLNFNYKVYALADFSNQIDEKYLSKNNFKGFKNNKLYFTISSLLKGFSFKTVILSHVNLLLIAYLIKLIKPSTRIIMFAHGIEIWRELPLWKKKFLQKNVEIWAVSEYTSVQIQQKHQIPSKNIRLLNNCLDPFISLPNKFEKPSYLLKKYNLKPEQPLLFTLARLSNSELYKGYDLVIKSLPKILKNYPDLKYIIAGKADEYEKKRLAKLIEDLQLQNNVILTGFIPDKELTDHFLMADLFVMPSKKEGFGIVFIEATACGCPIIAGNKDGSVDALLDGKLGKLIDPDKSIDMEDAIISSLNLPLDNEKKISLQNLCLENFSFKKYQDKVSILLNQKSKQINITH